jgi:hypothetical protein
MSKIELLLHLIIGECAEVAITKLPAMMFHLLILDQTSLNVFCILNLFQRFLPADIAHHLIDLIQLILEQFSNFLKLIIMQLLIAIIFILAI